MLKEISAVVGNKNKKAIDHWTESGDWNGVYTSKHIVLGMSIKNKLQYLVAKRKGGGEILNVKSTVLSLLDKKG